MLLLLVEVVLVLVVVEALKGISSASGANLGSLRGQRVTGKLGGGWLSPS